MLSYALCSFDTQLQKLNGSFYKSLAEGVQSSPIFADPSLSEIACPLCSKKLTLNSHFGFLTRTSSLFHLTIACQEDRERSMELEFSRFHCFTSLVILIFSGFVLRVGSVGINYGQIANNLPTPEHVIPLVKSVGATKVKLYDADPKVLKAFANTGVEFIVGLGNEYLSKMKDPDKATAWVKQNVQAYLPATKITCITIGNEVLTFNDTSLSGCLLPAMEGIHTALVNLGLDKQVTVTTAHSLAVLETSYPPSAGRFRKDLVNCITPVLDFHSKTGSPFLINAYPYFAYKANPKQVPLDFVLFQPSQGIVDPSSNLHYENMLFAQIDAVYSALGSVGYKKLTVHISETGWPSKGDENEAGATLDNAKMYNGNLIKLVSSKKGTPMRPNCDLNIYVFALFNENMKPGPTSERNYGLFKPDGTPVYALGINSSTNTNISLPSPPAGPAMPDSSTGSTPSSNGYLSISSALERKVHFGGVGAFMLTLLMMMNNLLL